ncbi:hypothetical protein FRC03_002543 [Tulasnella sp. 419]|nr:hypothetical protein FRC03_002543 [Tulasnella sp. 419]
MVSFIENAIFGSLSSVDIKFPQDIWADTMRRVLGALSTNNDSLQSLHLSLPSLPSASTPGMVHASWSSVHFQLLLGLKNLQYLKLRGPFDADDDQSKVLCQGLTELKSLILEGETTNFTVDALKCCDQGSDHPLTNLTIPIDGSEIGKHDSLMELPRNLKSLSIHLLNAREDKAMQLAAAISSACPGNTSEAIGDENDECAAINQGRELKELREMYQQVAAERDVAVRERKTLEVLVGSICSDESTEVQVL